MRQEEFLKALEKALGKLKKSERLKYVESYRELLADMMESGISEADAVAKQGDVKAIAAEIVAGAAPNEKRRDVCGVLLVIFSAVMVLFSLFASLNDWILSRVLTMLFNIGPNESASIGIIGGADGPTAIFVSSVSGDTWFVWLPTIIVVAATIWYFVRKRKKQ